MIPESSVLGDSTHERISPDGLMLKKTELEQRDSREYTENLGQKISQTFSHPVRDLEACAAGKAPKVVLIGCEGRGMETLSTFSAEGQSKLLLILLKMQCV